jgi:hypothetical protein
MTAISIRKALKAKIPKVGHHFGPSGGFEPAALQRHHEIQFERQNGLASSWRGNILRLFGFRGIPQTLVLKLRGDTTGVPPSNSQNLLKVSPLSATLTIKLATLTSSRRIRSVQYY